MAEDRMRDQDQDRNFGGATGGQGGEQGRQNPGGQQNPGRNPKDDQSTGERDRGGNINEPQREGQDSGSKQAGTTGEGNR